jgi:pimeloyl-ACP methyl ester carboxylesterase
VVAFDFRGHGRSGGQCTAGAAEILDVRAAVAEARRRGATTVVTVGFSMGGAVVLRHAADQGPPDRVDAAVSVSAPSRWFIRDTEPMRRVHWLCETISGRLAARVVLNTRLVRAWDAVPPTPIEVVHRIAGTPLLLVHGDADRYFGLEHPRALAAAAGPDTDLWVIDGMGHAESAVTPEVLDRIACWSVRRTGHTIWAGR